MKRKNLFLALAALAAAAGLWFARSAWRAQASQESSRGVETARGPQSDLDSAASSTRVSATGPGPGPNNRPKSGQMLRPPNPTQKFIDFTPEERVQFARRGQGPGG